MGNITLMLAIVTLMLGDMTLRLANISLMLLNMTSMLDIFALMSAGITVMLEIFAGNMHVLDVKIGVLTGISANIAAVRRFIDSRVCVSCYDARMGKSQTEWEEVMASVLIESERMFETLESRYPSTTKDEFLYVRKIEREFNKTLQRIAPPELHIKKVTNGQTASL